MLDSDVLCRTRFRLKLSVFLVADDGQRKRERDKTVLKTSSALETAFASYSLMRPRALWTRGPLTRGPLVSLLFPGSFSLSITHLRIELSMI